MAWHFVGQKPVIFSALFQVVFDQVLVLYQVEIFIPLIRRVETVRMVMGLFRLRPSSSRFA